MFVFFSKLLPTLVYPLGLAIIAIIAAILLQRRARLQRVILILALATLWMGGNRWVATSLAHSLEWRYPSPDPIPHAQVLVLLGGGTDPPDPPRRMVEINSAGDRVLYAAQLYREGKTDFILVSGGLLDWERRATTPAQDMASLLVWMRVPQSAIWEQGESHNTYEDALFCAEILKEKKIGKILLVTSAWHMPRSVKLFQAQGLDVIPIPTDYNVTKKGWDQILGEDWRTFILNLFPSVNNLALTTKMLKEYLGLFVYGLRGWTR
jgi:uncharacterized SAM-binding protein YcdF (DUF218 family)